MKKIKICFVIDSLEFGGTEKLTLDVVSNMNKEKFQITIITLLKKELPDSLKSTISSDIQLIEIDSKKYNYFKRLQVLWSELKKFDIVHSCLQTSNLYCSMIHLFKKFNYVVTAHGVDGVYFEDVFISYKYFFLTKHVQTFLFKFVLNYIAVSENTRKFLNEKRKIPYSKIKVIYHGLNLKNYPELDNLKENIRIREKYGIHHDDFVISYIGRFVTGKGLEELITSFHKILKSSVRVKLMMVGDGAKNTELKDLVKKLNLGQNVIFTGYKKNIIPYFSSSNLVVLPSYSEGVPISILEAMYYNCLVLTSDVGGLPELIENGVNGFLFPKGNFDVMIHKIKDIISNYHSYSSIKNCAKITVEEKFDLKMNVLKIENYFNYIINSK